MISYFHHNVPQQSKLGNKQIKMLEFLLKNGELDTSNGNGLASYRNSIYERIIYHNQQKCTITIFGTLSPHSERYVALESHSQFILLNTDDLAVDMDTILSFLNTQNIDKTNLIKVLFKITRAYQYNIELKNRLIIHPPPRQN